MLNGYIWQVRKQYSTSDRTDLLQCDCSFFGDYLLWQNSQWLSVSGNSVCMSASRREGREATHGKKEGGFKWCPWRWRLSEAVKGLREVFYIYSTYHGWGVSEGEWRRLIIIQDHGFKRLSFSYMFVCPVVTIHFPITNPIFLQAMPISTRHLYNKKKRKGDKMLTKQTHTQKRGGGGFSWQLVSWQTVLRVRLIHRCSLHCRHKSDSCQCKLHLDKQPVGSHVKHFWLQGKFSSMYGEKYLQTSKLSFQSYLDLELHIAVVQYDK